MKVLHVAECIGGVDRYLRNLLKYSSCENIMVLSQLYNIDDFKESASHVETMNMDHSVGLSALKEAKELRLKIKKYSPDVVYAHSSIAGAITRLACIGLKVKVIYNPHGWSFNMKKGGRKIYIALEKLMAHFCDAIICISEAEKKSALREKICKENKLYVIENGIDFSNIQKEDISLQIPNGAYVVGMVGRICMQKAPDIFVRMAGKILEKIRNVYFIIVGDVIEEEAKQRGLIEDLADSLGVDLYITGWVSNPLDYMNRFDVGCLLSRWEGFGLVIPEYMLTQTPIVATNVDAIPYLIEDGVNGLLVEMDDWQGAAEKVVELLNDKEKRDRMISNGLKTVKERFDARRVSKECEELYSVLIR